MPYYTARPLSHVESCALAFRLANRAAIEDLEDAAARIVAADGVVWWDVRPMLDEREASPEVLDMRRQALAYLEDSGLIHVDRATPHMVRVLRRD